MKDGEKFIVLYFSKSKNKPRDAEFWALLTFIKERGYKYSFYNVNLLDIDSIDPIEISRRINCKVVYLHVSDIVYLHKIKNILPFIKNNKRLIILGGDTSISLKSKEILSAFKNINIIIRQPETEKVLLCLLNNINNKRKWNKVEGITLRNSNDNQIISNKNRILSKNLDHLSNLGLFDNDVAGIEWYPIIVSRGCNYNCQYCGYNTPYTIDYYGETNFWRGRSEKKIADDIEYLVSKGVKKFKFYCNQFFSPEYFIHNNAVPIGEEIIKRRIDINFTLSSKPFDIKRNYRSLFILRESGMSRIDIGIDSGINRFMRMYKTGSSIEDNIEVLKFLHENSFNFDVGFIFYDPYLTPDEINKNLIFLRSIKFYFSNQTVPYSGYLDSRILNSVLILRYGMPIIEKLKKDNLILEYPGLSKHPIAKFKNQNVKYIYSIYRSINESALPKIRHFFYNKKLVNKYDFINMFPLRVIEEIIKNIVENKLMDLKECISNIEEFIKNTFRPCIDDIFCYFPSFRNEELKKWLNL